MGTVGREIDGFELNFWTSNLHILLVARVVRLACYLNKAKRLTAPSEQSIDRRMFRAVSSLFRCQVKIVSHTSPYFDSFTAGAHRRSELIPQ